MTDGDEKEANENEAPLLQIETENEKLDNKDDQERVNTKQEDQTIQQTFKVKLEPLLEVTQPDYNTELSIFPEIRGRRFLE